MTDFSDLIDPTTLPVKYAMLVEGDCMKPLFAPSAKLMFSREECDQGDIVVLWHIPEGQRAGERHAILKRLITAVPKDYIGRRPVAGSECEHVVIVEQLNPKRRMAVPCGNLLAVHKCLGP